MSRPTPETDNVAQPSSLLQYETVNANFARKLERERDEAREALKCIDGAIFDMKPRHIGNPTMDGRYPCWSVWLPQCGRVERKSLQDALLEFVAQIKEGTK